MFKNKIFSLAMIMFILALITSYFVAGTYSKYVSNIKVADKAVVANWGVKIEGIGEDLFQTNYTNNSISIASSTNKIVAPGTSNSTKFGTKISGKPDVAAKVEIKITDGSGNNPVEIVVPAAINTYMDWTTANILDDTFSLESAYYPVVFTLKHTKKDQTPIEVSGKLIDILNYINTNINKTYVAGSDLEKQIGELELSWEWKAIGGNDQADTLLGNISSGIDTNSYVGIVTNCQFSIEVFVTQVD